MTLLTQGGPTFPQGIEVRLACDPPRYLPENAELIAGDLVTTSGRGGVYPAGLAVGHVEEVHTEASGMTRYAVIVPETDLDGLKQVFVIKEFTIVE